MRKAQDNVHKLLSKPEKQDIFSQENLFDTFFKAKDSAFDLLILSENVKLLGRSIRKV